MRTLEFDRARSRLILIDQTRLPLETRYVECATAEEVGEAIRGMQVRGAPAIGVAAAYGLALGAAHWEGAETDAFVRRLEAVAERLIATRPTAVNLRWAVERGLGLARQMAPAASVRDIKAALLDLADDDVATNRRLGAFGQELVRDGANVLTHCNAGALATVDYGTALGVVRAAHESGKQLHVYVDETRPYLQGARLTSWELQQLGIPMTLITDNMAGAFMQRGAVDLIVVGADRITANGDVANKIGTYSLAVLASAHGIPLYVAAPTSTIDLTLASGADIPIEQRSPDEVLTLSGQRIAPHGTVAAHPAFDVTPARLVSAIVTEQGVLRPPYEPALRAAVAASSEALAAPPVGV
ncbi:MAG: S-methyl-5-thioribose-1-phosphate isomerase [Chloroflexi bacterium]|nr:S-methyl-5-thioribose-1-phosphate isomerase [Chloroflexota bacterium]